MTAVINYLQQLVFGENKLLVVSKDEFEEFVSLPELEQFVIQAHELFVYMQFNDPPLVLSLEVLGTKTFQYEIFDKNNHQWIDGFPKSDSTVIVVLDAPKTPNNKYAYMSISKAVLVSDTQEPPTSVSEVQKLPSSKSSSQVFPRLHESNSYKVYWTEIDLHNKLKEYDSFEELASPVQFRELGQTDGVGQEFGSNTTR